MIWPHFSEAELKCRCGCGREEMDNKFMTRLVALRDLVGFPLPVTSGFRCRDHNAKVSSTGPNGPHTTGKAVDILINRVKAAELLKMALMMGFKGIGARQHGDDEQRIVHLDDTDRPYQIFWTY